MKHKRHHPHWHRLALILAAACMTARGQVAARRPVEDPQWLRLRPPEGTVGLYGEGQIEETSIGDTKTTHERFFLGPLFGIDTDGSIYHPNLFRFVINSEIAAGLATDHLETGRASANRSEFEYLGRLSGNGIFLANKPYNATIFGDQDHSYRDYDFFNRVTVDSSRYGAKIAYDQGPLPMSVTYTHYEETTDGELRGTGLRTLQGTKMFQDVLNYNVHNERGLAGSSFNYTFDRYSRNDFGRNAEGVDHTITAADNERFGSHDQIRLLANMSYSHREDVQVSDEITSSLNLSAEHRPDLSSFYDFTYDKFQTGNFDSSSYIGRAELRHQLYESLTSSLIGQASDFEAADGRNNGYTRRYGIGLGEAYVKKLGKHHRMRISNTFFIEQVDQQGIGTVENERHTFSEFGAPTDTFFLNLPNVKVATIVVTDQNDSQPPFVQGIDYRVQENGDRVLIVRLGGSRIGATDPVLVDYEAEATGSGQYQAYTETAQIRFDLFDNLWGVYARANLSLNNADRDLRVPDIAMYAVGSDVSYRWFRGGAEYEIYDSDLSRYNSARVFESALFALDQDASISFDFSQTWTDYHDAHRQEVDYRFISRFHQNIMPTLRLDVEGGVDLRQGRGVDQTLATFRPGIDWRFGKTSLKAGYDFEYNLFLEREERIKHLFFIRLKRTF